MAIINFDSFILNNKIDYAAILSNSFIVVVSFLPIEYWKKRGFILLLQNPSVIYIRLPYPYKGKELPKATIGELQKCFNPISIAKALEKDHPGWLAFYMKHEFGKTITENKNPLREQEFLGKLILSKLAVFNHSKSNDLLTQYIMPMKNALEGLQRFPNKESEILPIIRKLQDNFFSNYNVLQVGYLLQEYVEISKNRNDKKLNNLKDLQLSFSDCKSMLFKGFDYEQISYNLEILSNFYTNYKAVKK